jgi:hypothetical protein
LIRESNRGGAFLIKPMQNSYHSSFTAHSGEAMKTIHVYYHYIVYNGIMAMQIKGAAHIKSLIAVGQQKPNQKVLATHFMNFLIYTGFPDHFFHVQPCFLACLGLIRQQHPEAFTFSLVRPRRICWGIC